MYDIEAKVVINSTAYDKLEPIVKDQVDLMLECYALDLLTITEKCESPIEKLLGTMLKFCRDAYKTSYKIEQQKIIQIDDKTYRVDFLVSGLVNGNLLEVVVECDGHEFHEKTKAQAIRDKKRDRLLTKAGYKIMRFTGTEILKDPIVCAEEIVDLFRLKDGDKT